jgi:hypothetical protein
VIGVHAIFGAFLFGLVVPREGGLAVSMMEKLEDVVGSVFLPLVSVVFLPSFNTSRIPLSDFIYSLLSSYYLVLHPLRTLHRPRPS